MLLEFIGVYFSSGEVGELGDRGSTVSSPYVIKKFLTREVGVEKKREISPRREFGE